MRRIGLPFWGFLLLWALPVAIWVAHRSGAKEAGFTLLAQCLLLLSHARLKAYSRRLRHGAWLRFLLRALGGLLVLLQLVTVGYLLVQGFALDPFFALDNAREAVPTLFNSFSAPQLVLGMLAMAAAWCSACWLAGRVQVRLPERPKAARRAALLPLLLLAAWGYGNPFLLVRASFPLLMKSSRLSGETPSGGAEYGAVTRRFMNFKSKDGAPLFIVQLESVNAMALAGMATQAQRYGLAELAPVLNEIKSEGVFAPFMWGASMQTHRGRGAILCSSVLDLYAGVSLGAAPKGCLPELLRQDGYHTVFTSAHPEPNFANSRNFSIGIGFTETHYADLMRKRDKKHGWGYDDCAVYDRNFDYFDKKYGSKMNSRFMAYFEMTASHNPFNARRGKVGLVLPFSQGGSFVHKYLNAQATQDFCLRYFMTRVDKYRDRAHIIVVGDHSWPVGIQGMKDAERGATPENFLIPFLYLPPRQDAQYRRGAVITDPVPGQADITPTVLELLSGKPYENSFAALLKAGKDDGAPKLPPSYDDCHVMTQPYDGGQVAVVRGQDKVTYRMDERTVRYSTLGDGFSETPVGKSEHMPYRDFLGRYLCGRFHFWLPKEKGARVRALPYKVPYWSF